MTEFFVPVALKDVIPITVPHRATDRHTPGHVPDEDRPESVVDSTEYQQLWPIVRRWEFQSVQLVDQRVQFVLAGVHVESLGPVEPQQWVLLRPLL